MAEGYGRRHKQRMNELIFTAWHVEAFARQKKLPALKSLMQETHEKPKREQTDDEMMAICRMLNAAFGGMEVEA